MKDNGKLESGTGISIYICGRKVCGSNYCLSGSKAGLLQAEVLLKTNGRAVRKVVYVNGRGSTHN